MGFFKKAVKEDAKLRMAITGPSGSGKTYSALSIASALANGKPVAVVDTEHGSASKYSDIFSFDTIDMHAPFHPDKYIDAIAAAAKEGYSVVILDSLTHAWSGEGGLLDVVKTIEMRMKNPNSFAAWKDATPIQNRLIEAIVSGNLHIICTMRSKTDYVMQTGSNGKITPQKVGMAPIQRDGFEYEFDVVLDMDNDNNAIVSKSRCPELSGKVIPKPGKQVANILTTWLHGVPVAPKPLPKPTVTATPAAPVRVLLRGELDLSGQDLGEEEFSEIEPVDPNPRPGERGSPILPGESVWGLRGEKESQLEDPPPARTRSETLIDEIQKLGVKVSGTAWQQRKAKAVSAYSNGSAESIDELPIKSLELIHSTLTKEAAALNITTGGK